MSHSLCFAASRSAYWVRAAAMTARPRAIPSAKGVAPARATTRAVSAEASALLDGAASEGSSRRRRRAERSGRLGNRRWSGRLSADASGRRGHRGRRHQRHLQHGPAHSRGAHAHELERHHRSLRAHGAHGNGCHARGQPHAHRRVQRGFSGADDHRDQRQGRRGQADQRLDREHHHSQPRAQGRRHERRPPRRLHLACRVEDLFLPQRSARRHLLVPRSRDGSHRSSRLQGDRRLLHHPRSRRRRAEAPLGQLRRAAALAGQAASRPTTRSITRRRRPSGARRRQSDRERRRDSALRRRHAQIPVSRSQRIERSHLSDWASVGQELPSHRLRRWSAGRTGYLEIAERRTGRAVRHRDRLLRLCDRSE